MKELFVTLLEVGKWLTSNPEGMPYLIISVLTFTVWRVYQGQRKVYRSCESELLVVTKAFVRLLSVARENAGKNRVIFSTKIDIIESEMLSGLGKTREELFGEG